MLVFNKSRLGADWFEQGITEDVLRLRIQELGHEFSADHLNAQYHEALCRIGARMFLLAPDRTLRPKPAEGVGNQPSLTDRIDIDPSVTLSPLSCAPRT